MLIEDLSPSTHSLDIARQTNLTIALLTQNSFCLSHSMLAMDVSITTLSFSNVSVKIQHRRTISNFIPGYFLMSLVILQFFL